MAKVQRVMFKTSFFDNGVAKYEAGKHYPVTRETRARVLSGDDHAEYVEIEMDKGVAARELAAAEGVYAKENKRTLAAEEEAAARRRADQEA